MEKGKGRISYRLSSHLYDKYYYEQKQLRVEKLNKPNLPIVTKK